MPRLSKIGAAALAAFGWTGISSVTASYLVVAGGGGGGGYNNGGGGGAGGLQVGTTSLNPSLSYTVTVGAGGAGGATSAPATGSNGSNSQLGSLTVSVGGGYGGGFNGSSSYSSANSGGSGGGGGAISGPGASGTSGQGNTGGNGVSNASGGGGGSGAVGSNGSGTNVAGTGGNGTASSITGTSVTYAGGGGGSAQSIGTQGTGGSGGGGNGVYNGNGNNGTANLGGGGGGLYGGTTGNSGGSGGSGVVIISYPAPQKFGGGVVTTSGSNVIHTFNTSGTLSPLSSLTANFLVVAGGGGGGSEVNTGSASTGGGGGAGGFRTSAGTSGGGASAESSLLIDTNSIYVVTVGAGGAGGIARTTAAVSGGNSSFYSVTSTGGGRGGNDVANSATGGSGGGGTASNNGSAGTASQGYAGGNGSGTGSNGTAGGGGGASAVGGTATSSVAGNGGAGVASSISGSSTTYAGGGGGGAIGGKTAGNGGSGGGGNGATGGTASSGTANTGGGGGGAGQNGSDSTGGAGGSGVVIISYAGSTQQMAGGTVTISSGNVIHTFTSSGYLTPIKYVNNSLRFRSSANANLTRTPANASNRKTWTWSAWVKRGTLSTYQTVFQASDASGNNETTIDFADTDNAIIFYSYIGAYQLQLRTTQAFRDPAAWYHIVAVLDTTQATSTNRAKLYINGVQVTAFSLSSYPSQNYDGYINYTQTHYFGKNAQVGRYFDGYLTEINFIDGQALTPNSFGTFNSYGVWQPITYGGSYGTNGFYLPFNHNTSTYAGSFNGSSQYLTVANNSAFDLTGDFTIECWSYITNVSPGYNPTIVARWGGTGGQIYTFQIFAGGTFRFITAGGTWTGGTIVANNWYHLAVSRTGSSLKMFINGVLQSTNTDSTSLSGTQIQSIGGENNGAQYVPGNISNVRIVKGTGLYTSNFVPSTSNLTAVSGTSLLTLQNATIVDNSTNAFTITNNGTTTTALTYPFSAGVIFADQSPAGNNWTPNNISGLIGSTQDYMTDVPTLTSATAANYCVINPLTLGSYVTLSSGNMVTTGNTATDNGNYRSTFAFKTGKWYLEVTCLVVGGVSNNPRFGILPLSNASTPNNGSTNSVGSVTNSVAYQSNGQKYIAGTTSSYGSSFTTGDVIGVAIDADNGTLVFYKNNTSQGTAFTWTGGSIDFVVAGSDYNGSSSSYNFGQQPWVYTPPTGYIALNTYNL